MEAFRQNFTNGLALAVFRKLDSEDFVITTTQTILWLVLSVGMDVAYEMGMALMPNSDTMFHTSIIISDVTGIVVACALISLIDRRASAFGAVVIGTTSAYVPFFALLFVIDAFCYASGIYSAMDAQEEGSTLGLVVALLHLAIMCWGLVVVFLAIRYSLDAGRLRGVVYFILYFVGLLPGLFASLSVQYS